MLWSSGSCYYSVNKKQVAVWALTWKTGENVGLEVSPERMEQERFFVGCSGRRPLLSPSLLGIEQWVSPEDVSGVYAMLGLSQVRYCHPSQMCTVSTLWRWLFSPLLKGYTPKIITDWGGHRDRVSHFLGKEMLGLIRLLQKSRITRSIRACVAWLFLLVLFYLHDVNLQKRKESVVFCGGR